MSTLIGVNDGASGTVEGRSELGEVCGSSVALHVCSRITKVLRTISNGGSDVSRCTSGISRVVRDEHGLSRAGVWHFIFGGRIEVYLRC